MRRLRDLSPALATALLLGNSVTAAPAQDSFVNFETPHVHPLERSSGGLLLAVNTADAVLEVFDATGAEPVALAAVPVGYDPVSVRARTATEVWVVNHLSDSVSVVDLNSLNVVATLPTDDEPCDVVFAGSPERAFVSCSQANSVLVFDPLSLATAPTRIESEAEDPRALAVSPEGAKVYAAVFESGNAWLVGGIATLMIVLASVEAVRRAGRTYAGVRRDVFLSLLVAAASSMLFVTTLILHTDPWWTPRYLIPLLGMVLGNGLTGISLGLERCLAAFEEERPGIELWISAGARPWEAARPVASRSLKAGLIPILNAMSVAGMVTIPGMMTGQILGGTEPGMAARYQILVMFLIAGATVAGTTGVVLLAVRALFDERGRLLRSKPR